MAAAGGRAPGGSVALLRFVEEHRAAIRFDFRDRFGISADDIGDTVSFGEAIDLIDELAVEMGTHLQASMDGWQWPASWSEINQAQLTEAYFNVHRDEKKRPQPFVVPMPWPGKDQATPEERAAAIAQLERRSVFRDQT